MRDGGVRSKLSSCQLLLLSLPRMRQSCEALSTAALKQTHSWLSAGFSLPVLQNNGMNGSTNYVYLWFCLPFSNALFFLLFLFDFILFYLLFKAATDKTRHLFDLCQCLHFIIQCYFIIACLHVGWLEGSSWNYELNNNNNNGSNYSNCEYLFPANRLWWIVLF